MQIAYLMNSYPMTSTTFIRREIHALERLGVDVTRYAVRHWDGELVEALDIEEQSKTHYLLSNSTFALPMAFFSELIRNPIGLLKTLGPWVSLIRTARGGFVRHVAYLLQAIYFKQQASKDKIDHVHCHFATNATAVAMLAKYLGGPSYSFTVHGPDELDNALYLSFPAKVKNAAFVAAISHFCKSQIIRFTSSEYAEKIELVHCGLNLEELPDIAPPKNNTFVCVGRLCPQKGQMLIPRAVAELVDEYPDIKVLFVGDGDIREALEDEISRLNLKSHFELGGWMDGGEVKKAISDGRIFLLPTFAEGLPVVLMEAYAYGRPAISTYIAGIPELIDSESGWIIPAGSNDALTKAMREALAASDKDITAKAKIGRQRVLRHHDVNKEAKKLFHLFTS